MRTNSIGQTVNKWVPHNPSDLWSREYLSTPLENITFNEVINSGETIELLATNSITLIPGFHANEGSNFHAAITSTSEDITCLPNPRNNIILKSGKIESSNETIIDAQNIFSNTPIGKIENCEQIIISPNPNKGNFIIDIQGDLSNNAKVEIYGLDGSLKYSSAIISKQYNVVFTQNPGTYLVRIYNNEKYYTEKIILQQSIMKTKTLFSIVFFVCSMFICNAQDYRANPFRAIGWLRKTKEDRAVNREIFRLIFHDVDL